MPELLERLQEGPVICAEGYLFELERRGYLQAGGFVPEVVLEHPEKVAELHREFVHAGSDVVEAFTYYAHREKLRLIGKEELLEEINRQALRIAAEVARESGAMLAGNVCNTNVYGGQESRDTVRRMFEEQVGWAVEAGVDFVIAETISWLGEAEVATEVIKATGLPAVVTLTAHKDPDMREGVPPAEACRRLEAAGADVVGLNCSRGPATMLPLLRDRPLTLQVFPEGTTTLPSIDAARGHGQPPLGRAARGRRGAARAVPHDGGAAELPIARGLRVDDVPGRPAVPDGARPVHVQPLRDRGLRASGL